MGAQSGTIKGIMLLREPTDGASGRGVAEVFVSYPAYTASSDTTTVAAVGAAIAAIRRDGKTVTLKDVTEGQAGMDTAGLEYFNDTLAVSTDAITGELSDVDGTEINVAATARPASFIVSYKAV